MEDLHHQQAELPRIVSSMPSTREIPCVWGMDRVGSRIEH
jgi:hypothetical protein